MQTEDASRAALQLDTEGVLPDEGRLCADVASPTKVGIKSGNDIFRSEDAFKGDADKCVEGVILGESRSEEKLHGASQPAFTSGGGSQTAGPEGVLLQVGTVDELRDESAFFTERTNGDFPQRPAPGADYAHGDVEQLPWDNAPEDAAYVPVATQSNTSATLGDAKRIDGQVATHCNTEGVFLDEAILLDNLAASPTPADNEQGSDSFQGEHVFKSDADKRTASANEDFPLRSGVDCATGEVKLPSLDHALENATCLPGDEQNASSAARGDITSLQQLPAFATSSGTDELQSSPTPADNEQGSDSFQGEHEFKSYADKCTASANEDFPLRSGVDCATGEVKLPSLDHALENATCLPGDGQNASSAARVSITSLQRLPAFATSSRTDELQSSAGVPVRTSSSLETKLPLEVAHHPKKPHVTCGSRCERSTQIIWAVREFRSSGGQPA